MADTVFKRLGAPVDSNDELWFSESPAGDIARNEFFGSGTSTAGYIKYWTGSTWTLKPVKYWTGSAWVQKPVKFWNGSAWTLA
jgi:hypothetical protein